MKIKLDNAEKLMEYVKWRIGKVYNVPMLKAEIQAMLRLMDKYHEKDYPEVRIKLGNE